MRRKEETLDKFPEHTHHLDLVCTACVLEKYKKYDKLLQFVKSLHNAQHAQQLLKEIGE